MATNAKTIHCLAAVLWKEGQPLTIEEITVDPPQRGEVRVKNVAAGICASDAHFIWNQETDLKLDFKGLPVVLGHEGSAVVEAVGEGVTSVVVGDSVIPLFIPNCEQCALCRNPRTNRCSDANFETLLTHGPNGETRLKLKDGRPLLSFCGTATFSQFAVLRASQICKVSKDLNLRDACILGCAVGTGVKTVTSLAKVHPGSVCVVWGLGAIGLSTCLGCSKSGAREVIGVDINPDKKEFAMRFGCTRFIDPNTLGQPIEEWLLARGGVDYAFDCIGNIGCLRAGQKSLTPWGTLVCVGLGPSGKSLEVKVADLLTGQRLMGGYFANEKSRESVLSLTEEFLRGDLPVSGLITNRFRLEDINEAFDLLKAGKSVRSVIQY